MSHLASRRTFDCIFYDDEIDALERRIRELDPLVDVFVLVEATRTVRGEFMPLHLRSQWRRVRPWAPKIRYVIVDDHVADQNPDTRVARLRESPARALADLGPDDVLQISGPLDAASEAADRERALVDGASAAPPVIICPYVNDADVDRVAQAFGLGTARGDKLDVYFWKDVDLIGPERAFERCWQQFPDRDVIILHTDMEPLPDDRDNHWYDSLLDWAARLPAAAALACNLLYAPADDLDAARVQCAGGFLRDGRFSYIGGAGQQYQPSLRRVREVDWVTFGGVYLRREFLDMCGGFDRRYEWAYVMDVDYCLEMTLRGAALYQVPVELVHHENQSTRRFLEHQRYRDKIDRNVERFYDKWRWRLG